MNNMKHTLPGGRARWFKYLFGAVVVNIPIVKIPVAMRSFEGTVYGKIAITE